MKPRRFRSVLETLLLCLSIGGASAAEPELRPEGVETIVVTGSRTEQGAFEAAVPVQSLSEVAVEDRQPAVLTDALREERGVHIQSTTPGQGSPYVRGLTGSAVLNLVDGMRLNHAIYRSSPNPYLALVDPGLVERIEIVRGPASVLYGSDAMSGVIQVLSRAPEFSAEEWGTRTRALGAFRSADASRRVRADVEAGREGFGLGLGFGYLETSDLRGGGSSGRQDPTNYSAWSGDARLLWNPAQDHRTQVDLQFLRQPSTPRFDELSAGFGQSQPASAEWSFEPLERLFAHARHEVDLGNHGFADSLRFDVSFQRISDDRVTRDFGSTLRVRERNRSEMLGVSAMAVSRPLGWLELSWGGEVYLDEVSSERRTTDLATGIRQEVPSRFPDGSRMDSYGVYASLHMPFTAAFSLQAGLRYSHFETRIASTATTPDTTVRIDDLTGGLGLSWEAYEGVRLLSNLGRGLRAPNVFDLGTVGDRPGNRFNQPTATLDPEVLYNLDLGVRVERGAVKGELFGFGALYDDKIASVFTGEVTPAGRNVVRSENVNRVWLAGVEASGSWRITSLLEFDGHIFYTWGEEKGSDGRSRPADRIPPLQGRIGLRQWIVHPFYVEPFVRFAFDQRRLSPRDESDPRIDPSGTDGWATLNLRLGGRWRDTISLTLAVENLTNASYREHGSGTQAPGLGVSLTGEIAFH